MDVAHAQLCAWLACTRGLALPDPLPPPPPNAPAWQGLDALADRAKPGNLARPRRFELAAAVNRLRTARLQQL